MSHILVIFLSASFSTSLALALVTCTRLGLQSGPIPSILQALKEAWCLAFFLLDAVALVFTPWNLTRQRNIDGV